jgi:hypothetical protein
MMNIDTNLSSIKKKYTKASPESFEIDDNSPRQTQGGLQKKPTDEALISNLRRTMEISMRNECYLDAIFFADKVLALSIYNSEQYIKAVYDLANAYFMNKEYVRCVKLIESRGVHVSDALTYQKFRILTAQAYLKSNNIESCIAILEKDSSDPSSLSFDLSILEEDQNSYYKGLKHLVLAKAYESQENNQCAAENYKLALKAN